MKDVPVLVKHRRAMFLSMGVRGKQKLAKADEAYVKWAKSNLTRKNLRGWIVETVNRIPVGSGCIWMQPVQPGPGRDLQVQPYLLSMYTHPRYRRRGIASMIVEEAIKWCNKNEYDRLVLHASDTGQKVYAKFGFKPTREMRLRLSRSRKIKRKRNM